LSNLAGFGVAVAIQIAIFLLFGLRTTLAENLAMGAIWAAGNGGTSRGLSLD
jgi:hypothetical protein